MSSLGTMLATMRSAGTLSAETASRASEYRLPRLFAEGEVIARRYKLVSVHATGGMGRIWNARDLVLNRSVAVKLVYAHDQRARRILTDCVLQEANTVARLIHPAIVELLDSGVVREREAYLVFELLAGENLRSLLHRKGCLCPERAVRLLLPILDALHCVHSHGIVHHDIKPENIVLARLPNGSIQPKLVDFGLAKWFDRRASNAAVLAGSPGYISPEQTDPKNAPDPRTDLWAFAVVLYEVIAGNKPWQARTWRELVEAMKTIPPRCLLGNFGVDPSLWAILARGLETRLEDRWATSPDFAAALETWLAAHGSACMSPILRAHGERVEPAACPTRRSAPGACQRSISNAQDAGRFAHAASGAARRSLACDASRRAQLVETRPFPAQHGTARAQRAAMFTRTLSGVLVPEMTAKRASVMEQMFAKDAASSLKPRALHASKQG